MSRLLLSLLAFALPLVFYTLYVRYMARRGFQRPPAAAWLIGVALAMGTFIVAALLDGVGDRPGRYVPAHMENGKIVDDHMEREAP